MVLLHINQHFVSIIDFNLELDGATLTGSKTNSGATYCVVTNHFQVRYIVVVTAMYLLDESHSVLPGGTFSLI